MTTYQVVEACASHEATRSQLSRQFHCRSHVFRARHQAEREDARRREPRAITLPARRVFAGKVSRRDLQDGGGGREGGRAHGYPRDTSTGGGGEG